MKYAKPNEAIEGLRFHCRNDSPTSQGLALLKWIDSLPAEFEIVEPGNVQVRWPEGVTRSELDGWCDDLTRYVPENADILRYLRQLAAIAPEEKKRKMKVLVTLDFGTHKVGPIESECEVDA